MIALIVIVLTLTFHKACFGAPAALEKAQMPLDFFSEAFFSRHCYYTYTDASRLPCQFRIWRFPDCTPWNETNCKYYEANTRTCKTYDCSVIKFSFQVNDHN